MFKLINSLLSLVAPQNCVVCGDESSAICVECSASLNFPDMCIGCKKPSIGGLTCNNCAKSSSVSVLRVVSPYGSTGKDLVSLMKFRPSSATAKRLGEILAGRVPYLEDAVVTFIPTTSARVRERGFDQAMVMAKSVGATGHISHISTLRRRTKSHQIGSGRKDRLDHMKDAFTVRNKKYIQGKTILLVDDVLTTGATMESAACVLKKAGAGRVVALVFARAE